MIFVYNLLLDYNLRLEYKLIYNLILECKLIYNLILELILFQANFTEGQISFCTFQDCSKDFMQLIINVLILNLSIDYQLTVIHQTVI